MKNAFFIYVLTGLSLWVILFLIGYKTAKEYIQESDDNFYHTIIGIFLAGLLWPLMLYYTFFVVHEDDEDQV